MGEFIRDKCGSPSEHLREISPSSRVAEREDHRPHVSSAMLVVQACRGVGGTPLGRSGCPSSSGSFRGEWICGQINYDLGPWTEFQAKSASIGCPL